MTPKQLLYLALTEQLSSQWARDEWLSGHAPESWQLAREIDDFLVAHMDNSRVGAEQFERNCRRLMDLYVEPHHHTAIGA